MLVPDIMPTTAYFSAVMLFGFNAVNNKKYFQNG